MTMTSDFTSASRRREPRGLFRGFRGRLACRAVMSGLAATAAAGLLTACGGASAGAGGSAGTTQAPAGGLVVSTRTLTGIGTVLVNGSGQTLYSPQQEARGVIKCTGGCLTFWFPVTVPKGAAPRAASGITGSLGTIKRTDDGLRQLTYNGKPLYTFRLDQAPGQAHGNNFTDEFGGQTFNWHAVAASGSTTGAGQPSSPPSNYSYPSGSSGY
jgi:predicted lipoprotein with Yx(FWY)xxD motif